jgi:hypothetical protein
MRKLVGFIGAKTLLFAGFMLAYPAQAQQSCQYAGQTYSDGSEICMAGFWHVCNDGSWHNKGPQC